MKVQITSPKGKEKLVQAFKACGAEVVTNYSQDVNLIIPTVDEEQWFFSHSDLPVMCNLPYTIDMCRDKAEFYRFCRRHAFNTPYTLQDELIAKPRFGKGSKGIIKLDRSYIVQENLSSFPEISVDYFANGSGNPLSIIPRYRKDVVNGESQSAEFINNMDLTEVTRLGKELGLIGHNVIQGFYQDGVICFTEVNCRFGGGSWLTFDKFNSPAWLTKNYEQFNNSRRSHPLCSTIPRTLGGKES